MMVIRKSSHGARWPAAIFGTAVGIVAVCGMRAATRSRERAVFDVSSWGARILHMGGRRWVHVETPHFTYHAPDKERLMAVQDAAEFAYARVREYFPGPAGVAQGHVFSVQDAMWNRALRKADRRRDSLAMQVGNEIFVLESGTPADQAVRIAHEMVHYRIWQLWGTRLPVWLDEGLAGCLGWDIAEAYRLRKGRQLSRARAGRGAGVRPDIGTLTRQTEYPAPGPAAEVFYRDSEALVRAIARKIGYGKLHLFVSDVAEGAWSWEDVLRDRFAFTDYDFQWLAEEIGRDSTREKDREEDR